MFKINVLPTCTTRWFAPPTAAVVSQNQNSWKQIEHSNNNNDYDNKLTAVLNSGDDDTYAKYWKYQRLLELWNFVEGRPSKWPWWHRSQVAVSVCLYWK